MTFLAPYWISSAAKLAATEKELSTHRRMTGEAFAEVESLKRLVLRVRDELTMGRVSRALDLIADEIEGAL